MCFILFLYFFFTSRLFLLLSFFTFSKRRIKLSNEFTFPCGVAGVRPYTKVEERPTCLYSWLSTEIHRTL